MKIVFLQDDFPPQSFGGAGISTYELALGMQKAGHDVYVVTTCRGAKEAGESRHDGLAIFKIKSSYNNFWRAWVSAYNPQTIGPLEEILKRTQPDIVHANNVHQHLSYHSLKIAKRHAKGVVITLRDTMAIYWGKLATKRYLERGDARVTWLDNFKEAGKRYNPFLRISVKRYFKYADKTFAVSDALTSALAQNGIQEVEAIYTGLNVGDWKASAQKWTEFQEKFSLKSKKIILISGRLSEEKGGEAALGAFIEVSKKLPEALLLIAGVEDQYVRGLKEKATRRGVEERVLCTGWISGEDLKAAYAVSDIVLVPSLYLDPLPRVVLEAAASGKPVVATHYGGAPEAVISGVTGYIVDPRSVEDLAAKTLDLLQNPEKAKKFGEAGRERIKAEFSLEKMVSRYLERYKEILTK